MPTHAVKTSRLAWLLWAFFAARQIANVFLLEPTTDEGLWLWNAHVEHWNLPDCGILHAALSPGNYWMAKGLFAVTGPSIESMRLLNVLLFTVTLAWWLRCEHGKGQGLATVLVMSVLITDPFLFRAASWAYLEPKLLALLLIAVVLSRRPPNLSLALGLGVVLGIMLSTKMTMAWVPALLIPNLLSKENRGYALVSAGVAVCVTCIGYWGVYATHDPSRFASVWQQHSEGRIGFMKGYLALLRQHDVRALFYMVIISAGVVWSLHCFWRKEAQPEACACLAGALYFSFQSLVQDRYLLPLGLLCLLSASLDLPQKPKISLACTSALVAVLLGLSTALHFSYIQHANNSGGWAMHSLIQSATEDDVSVAAPPCLSIGIRHAIVPSSADGHMNNPPHDFVPEFLVLQAVAAEPTKEDQHYENLLGAAGARLASTGPFYRLLTSRWDLVETWKFQHEGRLLTDALQK